MSNPIAPWASTPTYPSGSFSYSGKPTKIQPAVTYLTPGQPQGLSAQNLNFQFNEFGAVAGAVAVGQWMTAVANWNEPSVNVGVPSAIPSVQFCACWDAFYQQWIVAGGLETVPPSAFVSVTYDGGKSYSPIGPPIPTPMVRYVGFAVATNPTTGDLSLFRTDGATCSVTLWPAGTGAPTDIPQGFLAGCDLGILAYFNNGWQFVGTSGLDEAPNWTGFSATSANGVGAWANASSALPGTFASGTANPIQQMISAQSPTTLAVAMCGATPGTSTSYLMAMSTSTGWADMTPALPGPGGQQIRGLCFAPNDQLWGLLTQDPSGNSYLYTSPDLTAWTLVQTFTGFWSAGVAAVGSAWAVLVYNAAAEEGGNRVLYSGNVASMGAACTWSFAAYTEAVAGSGRPLVASPVGMLLSNAGAQGGGICNGVAGATNTVGSQLLRCEINASGVVATSNIAGYAGFFPTAATIAGTAAGATQQILVPINFGSPTFQSVNAVPAGAVVTRASVVVQTPFSVGTTIEIGQVGDFNLVLATGVIDSDLGTDGTYNGFPVVAWGPNPGVVVVTLGGSPTAGAGQVLIEYSVPQN